MRRALQLTQQHALFSTVGKKGIVLGIVEDVKIRNMYCLLSEIP